MNLILKEGRAIIFIFPISLLSLEGRVGMESRVWRAIARKAEMPTRSVILWVSKKAVRINPMPLIAREVVTNMTYSKASPICIELYGEKEA